MGVFLVIIAACGALGMVYVTVIAPRAKKRECPICSDPTINYDFPCKCGRDTRV